MKVANLAGRAVLAHAEPVDIWSASEGRFGPGPEAVLEHWAEFRAWAQARPADGGPPGEPAWLARPDLGAPSPRPRQVFAVGLNYTGHARESGYDLPALPVVFTKFPSAIAGPNQELALPDGNVDWEVELVVVLGAHAFRIDESQAWGVVAGLTVGQDISERVRQRSGPAPQFSLAKSFPGFGPTGPVLVTPDELPDPDDLEIGCSLSGTVVQQDRTSGMLFPVTSLVSWLSHITPLFPGDLIFTGTPRGIGMSRTPPRFLRPGDELVSHIEGIGRMRQLVTASTFGVPPARQQPGEAAPAPMQGDDGPARTPHCAGCENVKALHVPTVTVKDVQSIPAGSYQPPGSTQVFAGLPAFCRVTATIVAAPGSSIGTETWLPADDWNGRYAQVGTHGLGGAINWAGMASQLRRGFATAATDSGHVTASPFDHRWAIDSPARITDFAWRSVHELAVNAKRIIAAHYRRPAAYAYYAGSSTGGRDGLKSAQLFPNDFNGILAGTAIQDFTRAATQMLVTSQRLCAAGFQGPHGAALLAQVRQSVLAVYAADGVPGSIAGAFQAGQWDPRRLVSRTGQDPSGFLSQAQADAVAASINPLTNPVTREVLSPGLPLSSQLDWIDFFLDPVYPLAVYRMGLNKADWADSAFNLHEDLPEVEARLGPVNATDPDLKAFKSAGGKIIQYHGWEDAVSSPQAIVDYYDAVNDQTTHGGRQEQLSFYRLFMMPGVSHTGSGTGPCSFGQDMLPPLSSDPEYDAIAALQAWVEKGIAPVKFTATRYVNDDPSQGIATQCPLRPYPSQAGGVS